METSVPGKRYSVPGKTHFQLLEKYISSCFWFWFPRLKDWFRAGVIFLGDCVCVDAYRACSTSQYSLSWALVANQFQVYESFLYEWKLTYPALRVITFEWKLTELALRVIIVRLKYNAMAAPRVIIIIRQKYNAAAALRIDLSQHASQSHLSLYYFSAEATCSNCSTNYYASAKAHYIQ